MIHGITFSEQLFTSANFAHFFYTFLNHKNGITKGCGISKSDSAVYVQKGYFFAFGRMVQIQGVEEIVSPEVVSGNLYCKVVFEIDLSKENTVEEFNQGYFRTISSASSYPDLIQEDLDDGGTIYQMPWCQYVRGVNGISNFRDLRETITLDAIWDAISRQNASYKNEFDTFFETQQATILQMIADLENKGYAKADVVDELINTELPALKKTVSDGKTLVAAAITEKRVAAAGSDTFAVLAGKIRRIVLGSGNAGKADVLKGKTFTNDDGVEYTGTLEDYSGTEKSAASSLDTIDKQLQMKIPSIGKYSATSKLYATYEAIRSLIGLTADKLWYNTTILDLKSSRTEQKAKTWIPTTKNQSILAGTCITGTQIIKGDANLLPANIISGKSIFDVNGSAHKYAEKHGQITSGSSYEISAGGGDAAYFAKATLDLGFTPLVGFLIYYINGNRDITVFSISNGSSKYRTVMNFNQSKLHSYNSAAWNDEEEGVVCSGTKLILPVAYRNAVYDYWFAGYY